MILSLEPESAVSMVDSCDSSLKSAVSMKPSTMWPFMMSFSWGASNSVSHSAVGGQSAGRATPQSLSITKAFDKASPLFLKLLTLGKVTPKAELHCLKGTGSQQEPYLVIRLENVFVESLSWSSGSEEAVEHVSLAFSKVSVSYKLD